MGKESEFCVPEELITRHREESSLPTYRTEFMRDRDRLMYATAFRRLAGKTQIYTVGMDDHKKNRLTHTLEVAQIARTISLALGLDSDLAEAIALGHDFGHTPFGHAGEEMLHDIMIPNSAYVKGSPYYGKDIQKLKRRFERESNNQKEKLNSLFGFKHNIQSVRVCAMLEDSYRDEEAENIGLNLTNFALYGMMIHSSLKYNGKADSLYPNYQNQFSERMRLNGYNDCAWSFEAHVVKWADDFAQWHHDLEDALREGVLPVEKICTTIAEGLGDALAPVDSEKLKRLKSVSRTDRRCLAELSHIVVNTLVSDLVDASRERFEGLSRTLTEKGVTERVPRFLALCGEDMKEIRESIIDVSNRIRPQLFKGTIRKSIHHSRNVERMNAKGQYIIRKLFEAYYTHPQQLPDGPIQHLLVEAGKYDNIDAAKDAGIGEARVLFDELMNNPPIYVKCLLMRRICDHISSMTDHYAIEEYNNLYG